ncbi:MAG: deoxyribodipyrimidine photo-lyase [Pseudomonadota bacterium]
MTTIVWLRQDLRIADNPALFEAALRGPVVPVYILDETAPRPLGGASKWWLHHSLSALGQSLKPLLLLRGDPQALLLDLIGRTGADAVFWNRCYEPHAVERDKAIKAALRAQGIEARSFNGGLLHEPWELTTAAGGPFKVYSPFWRAALGRQVAPSLPAPKPEVSVPESLGDDLDDWGLLPTAPDWAAGWSQIWQPGEAGAVARLEAFLETGLAGYGILRDRPDLANVSRLSPHLHFGEISPRQIWARCGFLGEAEPALDRDIAKFLSELGWREFSTHLIYHYPNLPERNWKAAFDAYPWRDSAADLKAWRRGRTGYPIVDAGLRELWNTGYMHNRVRMVAASFLVKHLRLHWRHGEAWFWDTLLDADLANNVAGWQWVAGSGADAAPYFRIFNPITQGRKFDPEGSYVRRWCSELAKLDTAYIHAPFEAPERALSAAGIRLGETYPRPVVDHAEARRAALAGYAAVKSAAEPS